MSPCPDCSSENPDIARFCMQCGAALAAACPSCGATGPPGARFCMECGSALRTTTDEPASPPALAAVGEKKHITVLFADVAGSMDLQENLDAEVWAQIMGRFVSILAEGVRKYGGTVDKFTGDGIMALFGAPIAQEDHARRACHAAWHLTKAIGEYSDELRRDQAVELQVRLGLNSGEVVVGRVGDDVTLDPTALGHTVGLAQRMEAMAEPGRTYLTEHTARLVDGWFGLGSLGARPIKGAADPLGVYALGAPISSVVRRTVGSAPLVGRERELAMLDDALDMAGEGQFQVVGVVGEAGVGKSRLCEEFARSVGDRGITVRRATGVSHGRDVPLLPILAFQREYFGVTDTDDPEAARAKVTDRLLTLDPGLEDVCPVLLDFLEIPDPDRPVAPMAPEARMRRIFDAVRRITARRSERETLVLILEDLHWFDAQSEAFLERLIESYAGSRTLVVANFRPEFTARWMRHSYYHQLALSPLREQAVSELLGGLLGMDLSLAPLVSFVLERTGGNPFFVEEVVRALIEDGTVAGSPGNYRLTRRLHEIRVPPSVQAVLAARIDRLPAEQKRILEAASVIGRTFDLPVLNGVFGGPAEALDEALAALCGAELLQVTQPSTGEYRFWHPLTQEVAYGSLLSDRRTALHLAVGETLVELDSARQDERAALIAGHFQAAGDQLNAARWAAQAAAWAARGSFEESIRLWRATIDHLKVAPETEETLALGVRARLSLLRVGSRRGLEISEAETLFADGKQLARRMSDPGQLGLVFGMWGSIHFLGSDLQAGRAAYAEARELVARSRDVDLQPAPFMAMAQACVYMGTINEGLTRVEEAIARTGGDMDRGFRYLGYSPLLRNLAIRGELLARAGHLKQGRAEVERAIKLAREHEQAELVAWGLPELAHIAFLIGEGNSPLAEVQEAKRLAEEAGNRVMTARALGAVGAAQLMEGRLGAAVETLTHGLGIIREQRLGLFEEPNLLCYLARANLAGGDVAAARDQARQAVEAARQQGARVVECFSLLTLGRVLREAAAGDAIGDPAPVLSDALQLLNEVGAMTYEPFVAEERARLEGDQAGLREAARLYGRIGATGHASRLEAELSATSAR
jgi:predicted ATPase/class 3 adenylate cyclase